MSATATALAAEPAYHEEALHGSGTRNETLGMVLFIISEAIMFGSFFAQYFYARVLSPSWPAPQGLPEHFERVPAFPLPLILTVILLSSGFTAHFAQTAMEHDDREHVQGWLIVTILLGVLFLGGQAYEYATLFSEGLYLSSGIYGSTFYSLTGLHGLHVTGGLVALIGVLVRTFMGHFSPTNNFGLSGTILYWHFVDAVWVALLFAVYLI